MKCKIVAWSRRVLVDMQMVPSVHFGINIILWEQDEDATVLMRYSTSANLIWPMASFFFCELENTITYVFFIARLSLIWEHQAILGKLGQMRRLYCREIHQAYCATEGAGCGLIAAEVKLCITNEWNAAARVTRTSDGPEPRSILSSVPSQMNLTCQIKRFHNIHFSWPYKGTLRMFFFLSHTKKSQISSWVPSPDENNWLFLPAASRFSQNLTPPITTDLFCSRDSVWFGHFLRF